MIATQVIDIKHTATRNSFGSDILAETTSYLLPRLPLPCGSKYVFFGKLFKDFSVKFLLLTPLFISDFGLFPNLKKFKKFSLPNATANVAVKYYFSKSETVTATDIDNAKQTSRKK